MGNKWIVTILILIDGFLQYESGRKAYIRKEVTILILIDGFLQYGVTRAERQKINRSQSLF